MEPKRRGGGSHIAHINIRSIRNKFEQITIEFPELGVDILTVSETWLGWRDDNSNYYIPGYTIIRQDQNLGVGKTSFKKQLKNSYSNPYIEPYEL